jgi:hypothetical protein
MDRDFVRRKGTTVTEESFHRDESPQAKLKPGDEVFGCMLNLGPTIQHFGCVPGTHKDLAPWLAFGGFERVDDAAALGDFKTRATQVPYMPGQAIIFFQHIVHYITKPTSAQKKMDRYRLLQGFYLMDGAEAPFDYTECIETQVLMYATCILSYIDHVILIVFADSACAVFILCVLSGRARNQVGSDACHVLGQPRVSLPEQGVHFDHRIPGHTHWVVQELQGVLSS